MKFKGIEPLERVAFFGFILPENIELGLNSNIERPTLQNLNSCSILIS